MVIERDEVNNRLSKVVCFGDTIYLSGIVAPRQYGSIEEQAKWELETIETLLLNHGSNKSHLLNVTIYLRNMDDFCAMNQVWEKWFEGIIPPARTCVGASLASNHAMIEINAIAAKNYETEANK